MELAVLQVTLTHKRTWMLTDEMMGAKYCEEIADENTFKAKMGYSILHLDLRNRFGDLASMGSPHFLNTK
jgi:hypothetical protein